jgi:hypothetical protein
VTVRIAADIPEGHRDAIDAHAAANGRTRASEIRRMVLLYVTMIDRDRTGVQAPAAGSSAAAPVPIASA